MTKTTSYNAIKGAATKDIIEVFNHSYEIHRAPNMEAIRERDPKKAMILDKIFGRRIPDSWRPIYCVNDGNMAISIKAMFPGLDKEEIIGAYNPVTRSCETGKPISMGKKPWSGKTYRWCSEMSRSELMAVWNTIQRTHKNHPEVTNFRTYWEFYHPVMKMPSPNELNKLTDAMKIVSEFVAKYGKKNEA